LIRRQAPKSDQREAQLSPLLSFGEEVAWVHERHRHADGRGTAQELSAIVIVVWHVSRGMAD
jgi:hypothetical protein